MFNQEIFRKTALDKLSTPDDLDELLQVNSKISWLLLVSLLCLIMGGLAWGIFGRIVNKVPITGAIQAVDPPRSLIMSEPGLVDSIFRQTGDRMHKDQPVARYLTVNGSRAVYIVAPCDGELIELNTNVGTYLLPGATIAKIGGFNPEQAERPAFLFFVSEKMVHNLAIGQKVNILLRGHNAESVRAKTWINYIGKLPASDESINSVILDQEEAARLKKGNYYLVRTVFVPLTNEIDPLKGFSMKDMYGKVCMGEVITSQSSPFAYLINPSKNK